MQLEPECIPCILQQVLSALTLLKPEISQKQILKVQRNVMEYLISNEDNITTHLMGKKTYSLIAEALQCEDPYKTIKKENNQLALQHYEEVKSIVDSAEDPIFEALIISALGNTIDFGGQHDMNIYLDIQNFSPENLVINDYLLFKETLKSATQLLVLGDNAGEIVFDKLLISTLIKYYPDLEIIYSVRSGPIINDSTIDDAKEVGLIDIVPIIESSATAGIDFTLSSENFKKVFYRKGGVIISKGQGNFESLYQIEFPHIDIYYLLKAKCSLMKRIFNVKLGDLIFKRKTTEF